MQDKQARQAAGEKVIDMMTRKERAEWEENIRADERRKITEEGTKKCSQCKCEMNEHQLLHYDCLKHVKQEAYKKGQAEIIGELTNIEFCRELHSEYEKAKAPPMEWYKEHALQVAMRRTLAKAVDVIKASESASVSINAEKEIGVVKVNVTANSAPENAKEEEFNVWLERLVNFYQNKKAIETKPENALTPTTKEYESAFKHIFSKPEKPLCDSMKGEYHEGEVWLCGDCGEVHSWETKPEKKKVV
jgi:hypothetical protein